MKVAGLVLAAGASRRFGDDNKLLAILDGRPLAAHAADAMSRAEVDVRIAVVSSELVAEIFSGFDVLVIEPGLDQSRSFRQGVARAAGHGVDHLVVTLADMPRVTADVIDRVVKLKGIAAVTDGVRSMPPAGFPSGMFDKLIEMQGDSGAGALIRNLTDDALVRCPPEMLVDVDQPEDMARLQKNA